MTHYSVKRTLPRRPAIDRLMEKVIEGPNGCWLFTGSKPNGYGQLWDGDTMAWAHRLSYELHVGEIPEGLHLDHLCRTPACVNPWHLEPVTPRVNALRGVSPAALNAARDECVNGHAFDEANTYYPQRGGRKCRRCNADRQARYHAQNRRKAS